jgi:predicted Zn-dependent protease
MRTARILETLTPSLQRQGLEQIELFQREGRSRRFELGAQGVVSCQASEIGWAVRASGRRSSMFAAGTGRPPTAGPWPAPDGYPLPLPPLFPGDEWSPPVDLEVPLLVEREALELLDACGQEITRELPGARLLRAVLEDGASTSTVANSLGVDAGWRARSATLYIEAVAPGEAGERVSDLLAARAGSGFNPRAIGQQVATRLLIRSKGRPVDRDRGSCLLAPAVSIRLLGGLLPVLIGSDASRIARKRADRQGRLGSEKLTIIDDPRLQAGLSCSAVDGEGVPTKVQRLVEEGCFRRSLVGWWQSESHQKRPAGCMRRPSWREPPYPGPSHLFIRPEPSTSVSSLLSAVARGYYLVEALPGAVFDLEEDRFELPVSGFEIAGGEVRGPVAGSALRGRLSALLHGIHGIGRDLLFAPMGTAIGAPSLLVQGVEIGRR